ncbi:MAG: hypothetical protein ACK4OE_10960 [Acidovorax sp.]|uniref:hypothetical protein n=1 Tax=Acidovorax sp. TaxID=1872122 RepID=UPI00391BC5FE
MRLKFQSVCLVLFAAVAGVNSTLATPLAQQAPSLMVDAVEAEARDFLIKSIAETPYSALVVQTRVSIRPVVEKKRSGDEPEVVKDEIHTYHARVLETFRGKSLTHIRYEMVVEAGEGAALSSTPQILTLCAGPAGFYWPGTGASFPGTKDFVVIARRAGREVSSRPPRGFAQCN